MTGDTIPYTLIRSARRTLALELTPEGRLLVRAPKACPKAAVERFLAEKADWIREHTAKTLAYRAAHPEPTESQRRDLMERAATRLPGLVAQYAARMGVSPTGISVTDARKRFGSCSSAGRLCFSWRLMQYPEQAVEYVVVHELAHLRHMNHSPAFYAFVASVLPDYRARQALLKA